MWCVPLLLAWLSKKLVRISIKYLKLYIEICKFSNTKLVPSLQILKCKNFYAEVWKLSKPLTFGLRIIQWLKQIIVLISFICFPKMNTQRMVISQQICLFLSVRTILTYHKANNYNFTIFRISVVQNWNPNAQLVSNVLPSIPCVFLWRNCFNFLLK